MSEHDDSPKTKASLPKKFNPPGTPASSPPPRKEGWDHTEQVTVHYPANPDLGLSEAWGVAYYHYKPAYGKPGWTDFNNSRTPDLWWPLPAEIVDHDHTCHCAYGKSEPHTIGQDGCVRTLVNAPTIISLSTTGDRNYDRWLVDGVDVSWFTLKEQRGYHQHPCGCWSRSPGSFNSVDPDD